MTKTFRFQSAERSTKHRNGDDNCELHLSQELARCVCVCVFRFNRSGFNPCFISWSYPELLASSQRVYVPLGVGWLARGLVGVLVGCLVEVLIGVG